VNTIGVSESERENERSGPIAAEQTDQAPACKSTAESGMNLGNSQRAVPDGSPQRFGSEHFDLVAETQNPEDGLVEVLDEEDQVELSSGTGRE
jgi:hypothetical protein